MPEQLSTLLPMVVFEDQHVIVISKPAGLLSQGEHSGDPNVVDWLRQRLGRPYVGLVHRLDRNTSGLMVVAKRTKAAQRLTKALQEGALDRTYLAWVHGTLSTPAHWRHFLEKNERTNTVHVVRNGQRGKEAVLNATPVAAGEWRGHPLTLVEFRLETGRSHQIRVQASSEGHPLLGDVKYAAPSKDFGRPALHSYRLRFPHPISGPEGEPRILEFEAPLPDDMSAIKQKVPT